MPTPFSQYQNTQITTAAPEKILIMLYEGAVNFSRIAADRMNRGDNAGKGKYIGKALAIVVELMNTLNHDIGGEVSHRLESLYIYLIEQFTQANMNNSPKSLESAIEVLVILRDAWVEAVKLQKNERDADAQVETPLRAVR